MEIIAITKEHKLWQKTASFAKHCSWRAAGLLTVLMTENAFQPWERVFVALEDEKIIAFCTLTEKDEMPKHYDFAPFIGFVFVDDIHRGKRISEKLINAASDYAAGLGFSTVYIMSDHIGLYEKYGFEQIGEYETIYGWVDRLFVKKIK